MRQLIKRALIGISAVVLVSGTVLACRQVDASFINPDGEQIGTVSLSEVAGGVLVKAHVEGLTPGWHGFHIHGTGVCTPPDFKSAGGHFNPAGKHHGLKSPDGKHAGDLPNVYVGEDGILEVQVLASDVILKDGDNSLLDADNSAIVIHSGADDYVSDPAGDAGSRVACAVVR